MIQFQHYQLNMTLPDKSVKTIDYNIPFEVPNASQVECSLETSDIIYINVEEEEFFAVTPTSSGELGESI